LPSGNAGTTGAINPIFNQDKLDDLPYLPDPMAKGVSFQELHLLLRHYNLWCSRDDTWRNTALLLDGTNDEWYHAAFGKRYSYSG